jgi:hypothetical protein
MPHHYGPQLHNLTVTDRYHYGDIEGEHTEHVQSLSPDDVDAFFRKSPLLRKRADSFYYFPSLRQAIRELAITGRAEFGWCRFTTSLVTAFDEKGRNPYGDTPADAIDLPSVPYDLDGSWHARENERAAQNARRKEKVRAHQVLVDEFIAAALTVNPYPDADVDYGSPRLRRPWR